MKSLHEIEQVFFRTITANMPMRAIKVDELQFEINNSNQRKFDGMHGITN